LPFVGLADVFIVTGDSMTMLAEAAEMRKPLYIFDMGEGRFCMRGGTATGSTEAGRDLIWFVGLVRAAIKDAKVRLIGKFLPDRLVRNTDPIRKYLIDAGYAAWLGEDYKNASDKAPLGVTPQVIGRVKDLLLPTGATTILPAFKRRGLAGTG
jgi:hypothetical protein